MKIQRIIFACLALFFPFASVFAQDSIVDGVIAIVGSQVILKSDVEAQYQTLRQQGGISGTASRVKCQILEDMLFQKLLTHQAEVDSVQVTDQQVENEMDRRMRFFVAQAGSIDELEKFYGKSVNEIKDELRGLVRDQILFEQEKSKITENVTITPAEVKAYYRKIPKDSIPEVPSELEIGLISKVPSMGKAERELAIEKIKGYRDRILKGDDFATIAVLYSEDPGSAKKGGELGMFQRGTMRPEFEAAAFKLKPGEVSDIVETEDGFHIIQLIERRGDYINVRHILVQPQVSVYEMNRAKLFLDSIANLISTKKITFSDAVQKFSDDPSKNNGGMMIDQNTRKTKIDQKNLDPKVFFVVDKLKEGEISSTVKWEDRGKTTFRIYYLKSRSRPHKANLEEDYDLIQQMALNSKKDKVLQDWLDDKIDNTYIRIMNPYRSCTFQKQWIKTVQN